MYQSILVPLDGSAFSEQALQSAEALARRAHAAVHLVHVHIPIVTTDVEGLPIDDLDPQADSDARRRELAYLEQLHKRVAGNGDVSVSTALLEAPVVPALIDYLHAHAIDVMVMTTHGRGGFARFWLGSTTDTLIRESSVPMLLLRPDESPASPSPSFAFKHILLPLDGSAEAEAILECVVAFGMLMDSTYTLLRVVEPYRVLGYDPALLMYAGGLSVEAEELAKQAVTDYVEQVAERLRQQGLQVATRVVPGQQAAIAILADAEEHGIDMIAMATHGRHGPSRLLLGSTADKVIRGTHLPALVFHPRPAGQHLPEATTASG